MHVIEANESRSAGQAVESPGMAREPLASPQEMPRPTLLIVDDESGPRESLKIIFKDDYHVLTAESGAQALEILRVCPIHAAILDIRMGGMSGIELLGHLKHLAPEAGVIMLTAYETVETMRQALRLGACDYLAKPFDLTTMRAAVARAVERNRCLRQWREHETILRDIQTQLRQEQVDAAVARKQGEIYGMVLHDINNPLTAIAVLAMMAGERLKQSGPLPEPDLAGLRKELDQIEQQVVRCQDIARRYLGFVRRRPQERPAVAVNRLLADLKLLLRPNPALVGNELIIEPLAQEAMVRMNGTDLVQVLLNLASNALQATAEPHQVRVSARRWDAPLGPEVLDAGPHSHFVNLSQFANQAPLVEISVSDTGPGIKVTPLVRIFDAYYTTRAPGSGTGLGLTIVLHLVEQAGAGLRVASAPGEGATFSVFLSAA